MNFIQAVVELSSAGKDYCMRPVLKEINNDEDYQKENTLVYKDNDLYQHCWDKPCNLEYCCSLKFQWEVVKLPRNYVPFFEAYKRMAKGESAFHEHNGDVYEYRITTDESPNSLMSKASNWDEWIYYNTMSMSLITSDKWFI